MKLHHKDLARQKLSTSRGPVVVSADGHVETDDKDLIDQLKAVGFKPVFRVKPEPEAVAAPAPTPAPAPEPTPEPEAAPAVAPVAPATIQKNQQHSGKKGGR